MIHSDNIELASRCYALGVMNGEIEENPEKFLTIKNSYIAGASFFSPKMHFVDELPIKDSEILVEYTRGNHKDYMLIAYKNESDLIPNTIRWFYINDLIK